MTADEPSSTTIDSNDKKNTFSIDSILKDAKGSSTSSGEAQYHHDSAETEELNGEETEPPFDVLPHSSFFYSQWLNARNTSALFGLQGTVSTTEIKRFK